MEQPTEEQIQWFWEQCGFKIVGKTTLHAEYPDGTIIVNGKYLPIDLNNLFKYAVPRINQIGYGNILLQEWVDKFYTEDTEELDPTLALFWAIYKALGGAA